MAHAVPAGFPAGPTFGFAPGARVVVAMSGGVDSSVAAWMLREAGHPLVGLFMRNGVHVGAEESRKKSCCSLTDARDARMVAGALGIPFQAVDLGREFGGIVRYFLAEYAAGRTPNPCLRCNEKIKFAAVLDRALAPLLGRRFEVRMIGSERLFAFPSARLEPDPERVAYQ